MEKVELKKGIYWVGAIDWNVNDFYGYFTVKQILRICHAELGSASQTKQGLNRP